MDITEVVITEPSPRQETVLELLLEALKEFIQVECGADQCIDCALSNVCDDLEELIPKLRPLIDIPRDEHNWD